MELLFVKVVIIATAIIFASIEDSEFDIKPFIWVWFFFVILLLISYWLHAVLLLFFWAAIYYTEKFKLETLNMLLIFFFLTLALFWL